MEVLLKVLWFRRANVGDIEMKQLKHFEIEYENKRGKWINLGF
jgi:hypothetical protein